MPLVPVVALNPVLSRNRTDGAGGWVRKYPQFQQGDLFALTDAFRKLDVDDKGYIDEATAIKATQTTERQPYDVVRQALREVELDSSRRVELEDYVDVSGICGTAAVTIQECLTEMSLSVADR